MSLRETIISILAMVLIAAVLVTPIGCQVNRDNIRTKAIASSIDPIATSCALDSTDTNGNSKAICTLKASIK